jgi:hypothetical protein
MEAHWAVFDAGFVNSVACMHQKLEISVVAIVNFRSWIVVQLQNSMRAAEMSKK